VQDALDALITHLKAVTAVTDLTSTRIYGGELPDADVESMPRRCIVLRYAGGLESFRSHRVARVRIDIFSYGEGYKDAMSVDLAVADAVHAIGREEPAASGTLLHSVGYGGPIMLKEPEADWRYVARSATVIADERVTV
tara:strand:- start:132 stop:548 length:417 start_codon:yes stop_codon:yes gene_type:complete